MPAIERSTPSLYLEAKKLVRDAVRALDLDGLNDKEVVIRDAPWNHANIFRGISVWGNKVVPAANGSNYRNVFGHAVVLSMLRIEEGSPSGAEVNDRFPLWKSCLFDRFHNVKLPGITTNGATHLSCTVQDSSLSVPAKHQAAGKRWQGDQVVVWYWVRKAKDFGE